MTLIIIYEYIVAVFYINLVDIRRVKPPRVLEYFKRVPFSREEY